MSDQIDTLLDEASESLDNLEEKFGNLDTLEDGLESIVAEFDSEEFDTILGDIETIAEVADETQDLLDAIDFTDLPSAVDAGEVLEAVQTGEIPEAITEGDAEDVVNLRQLLQAINLSEMWDAANVRELWQAKREFDDATDEMTDDTDLLGDDDEDDDLLGDDDEMIEDVDFDLGGESMGLEDGDAEEYQAFIQQQAIEGIDEFREGLLEAHGKFERLLEYNRDRMSRQDTSTNSRNPTAASTLPTVRIGHAGAPRYSTVPRETRHSTAPNRKHIYGRRFEQERKKRGMDDE